MRKLLLLPALVIVVILFFALRKPVQAPVSVTSTPGESIGVALHAPISDASSRVTKKPFGTYVTPKTSPVQPEKFAGYHTGTDFETFPGEQTSDVAVMAVCTGPLAVKRIAGGYGGVAVQSCELNGASITVVYGHLRLTSIVANVGDTLVVGQQFAVLGTGYSTETDGERKHLHLGIHRGMAIDIRGYVSAQSDLSQWMDYENL